MVAWWHGEDRLIGYHRKGHRHTNIPVALRRGSASLPRGIVTVLATSVPEVILRVLVAIVFAVVATALSLRLLGAGGQVNR